MKTIKASEINSVVGNTIDLFICSSSFEDRCFVIPDIIKEKFSPERVLVFHNANEYKEIIDNANTLINKFPEAERDNIPLDTDKPLQNAKTIKSALDQFFAIRNYENLILDATTFTHESLLVLIKFLSHKRANYKSLFICYVGAEAYSTNVKDEDKWLSLGISTIRSVIGYPGVISAARENHLIVLFGFEYERTKGLIEQMQFNSVSLGFGPEADSIAPDHYKINYDRHCKLMKYFTNAHKFNFSLTDPFQAMKDIKGEIENYSDHNIVVSAMNTKLSTIGAALAAIENPKIQLIYAKPVEYNTSGYSKSQKENIYCFKLW